MPVTSERELDDNLSAPSDAAVAALARCPGDIVVLGAGGKMGPTLARMLRRAADSLGDDRRVVAVSRFGSGAVEAQLNNAGVETVKCDLLDRNAVARLPAASNVIFMAGQKFGTSGSPATTWAMNVLVPAIATERYADARIVAFSTGNVYGLTPVAGGGSRETDALAPVGDYAQSCVGRERMLEHYSASRGTAVAILRLNYANDLRYGVLTDIALAVWNGSPVDLTMGHVNVIWQRDANARALECLPLASSPPFTVNVTGSAISSVREIAERFGQILEKTPHLVGREAPDALVANTGKAREILGEPETSVDSMIAWTADWIREGRPLLGKPTHFAARDGAF
ncbi:MAG: NAD(P)-dependent oxidoreductase [Anaerolineae bacterium]|nr:NAD(P)-dependent oxidoreductase [Gemmatimonadaceae bacterium]